MNCLSVTERSTSPVSVNAPSFDLSAGPLPSSVFNSELSVCPVPVHEYNIECPTTLKEANTELVALSVTTQKPAIEPLNLPVMSPETINAFHVCHVNSVTAIETIYELSSRPVSAHEPDYELSFCPVSVSEPIDEFVFPATVPETVNALPVLSVSALPRSRSLPWFPAQSASLCWSSVPSAPPWWSSAQVWWSSAPVWWSSAPPWWSSAQVWWSSAPPWWAPVPSSLPWLPALPQSPVSPFPHGPGPPSLPLFRLRSTALLDCIGASGSRSLWGGGSVTNPVFGLPPDSHQRLPLHHIDSHTTQHTGLHFPSSIALTTHTQLITLITLTAENDHTITITQSHTIYKPWTFSL